jgi:hypothetical protein
MLFIRSLFDLRYNKYQVATPSLRKFIRLLLWILIGNTTPIYAQEASLVSQPSHLLYQEVRYTREPHSVQYYLNDLKDKGIRISYVTNHLDLNKIIIPNKEKCTLKVFLKDILRDQPLSVTEGNGKIIIARFQNYTPPRDIKGDKTIYIFCSDLTNPHSCANAARQQAEKNNN